MSKMIPVMSLKKKTSKAGNTYLGGSLGWLNFVVMPVKTKKDANSPDYIVYYCPQDDQPKVEPQKTEAENDVPGF